MKSKIVKVIAIVVLLASLALNAYGIYFCNSVYENCKMFAISQFKEIYNFSVFICSFNSILSIVLIVAVVFLEKIIIVTENSVNEYKERKEKKAEARKQNRIEKLKQKLNKEETE